MIDLPADTKAAVELRTFCDRHGQTNAPAWQFQGGETRGNIISLALTTVAVHR